jgi:hypothetical protein
VDFLQHYFEKENNMHWQQYYIIVMYCIIVFLSLPTLIINAFYENYKAALSNLWTLIFVGFGFYVLYSGGFFTVIGW